MTSSHVIWRAVIAMPLLVACEGVAAHAPTSSVVNATAAPASPATAAPTAAPTPTPSPVAVVQVATPTPSPTPLRTGTSSVSGAFVVEVTNPTQIVGRFGGETFVFRSDARTRFGANDGSGAITFGSARNFQEAGIKAGDSLQLQVKWDERTADGGYPVTLVAKR